MALVLVLIAVGHSYISPAMNLFSSWRESNDAQARLGELKAENESLVRRAETSKQPAAETTEARKLGLIGPGEQAFVVDGLKYRRRTSRIRHPRLARASVGDG